MTDRTWRPATVLLVAMTLVAAMLAGTSSGATADEGHSTAPARAASGVSAAANPGGACAVVKRQAKKAKKAKKKAKRKLNKIKKASKAGKKTKKSKKTAKKLRKKLRKSKKKLKAAKQARKRLCRTATLRVSVSSKGVQANDDSDYAAISANDRYVVFSSDATNLVSGDTNNATDVFVHDLVTQKTKRVSISSKGKQGNDDSGFDTLGISADGRYVAFSSGASNLVPGDTNGAADVFVRDLRKKKTTRVSIASNGAQAVSGNSQEPQISANGRHVTFASPATNLTSKETHEDTQVYVHDRSTGRTSLVSHAPNGTPANGRSVEPSISADGRYIAYSTEATNFGATGDTWEPDVYVWDRKAGRSYVASVDDAGRLLVGWNTYPSISDNGQIVAFSRRENLLDQLGVAVTNRALASGNAQRSVTYGTNDAGAALVSGDGKYVVLGDYPAGVMLYERATGVATRIDVNTGGGAGNRDGWPVGITKNASSIVFVSAATNLVGGDTNNRRDIFVRRR